MVCLPYKVLHKFATCPLEGDGSWQWIKGYVDYEHLELPSGISTPQKWYAYIILTCTDSAMYDTFDEMLDDMNGWKLRQITDLYEIVSQVMMNETTAAFMMNKMTILNGSEPRLLENPINHYEYHERNVAVKLFAVILVLSLVLCTYGIPALYSLHKYMKECCEDDCGVNTKVSCHSYQDSTCYQVQ